MSYASGRITAPVSIADVQQALSNGSADLATLCIAPNINMWARYKPIRTVSAIVGTITYQTRKSSNFGLNVPFCPLDIMNEVVYKILYDEQDKIDWSYERPRGDRTPQGGIREYYRITDYCRHPQETAQSANGDPTPVNLQGYNHNAKLPFTVIMSNAGATLKHDSEGNWYEINLQVANQLVLTFYNSNGDDLHLQDFIDLTRTGDVVWRPVLQLFKGWDITPWYQKSQADAEVAGSPITTDAGGMWSVALPLSNLVQNQFYHLCVGVGCVSQDFSSWKDNNQSLFIAPYTQQQFNDDMLPFYYRFKLVNYSARTLIVTSMLYYRSGYERWDAATGTAPYFEIGSNATGAIRLTMTVTKVLHQAVDFVNETGSAQTAGAQTFRIKAMKRIIGEQDVTMFLQPANSSGQTAQYIPIPAAQTQEEESQTVTLYATLNIGLLQVGQTASFYLSADTGDSGQYTELSYFSVKRIS